MKPSEFRANLTLALMVIFLSAWAYTEITEYSEREGFNTEIKDFMEGGGNRFTLEDAVELEHRIEKLEREMGAE